MTIRKLALVALLAVAIAPAAAHADPLHGTGVGVDSASDVVAVRLHHSPGIATAHAYPHRRGHAPGHAHSVHGVRVSVPVRRAPVVHVHRHGACRFIEAHHTTRRVRVVVPGHHVERVIPARYAVRWHGHHYIQVMVAARRVVREWVPERVVIRRQRVWVPGRWTCG